MNDIERLLKIDPITDALTDQIEIAEQYIEALTYIRDTFASATHLSEIKCVEVSIATKLRAIDWRTVEIAETAKSLLTLVYAASQEIRQGYIKTQKEILSVLSGR